MSQCDIGQSPALLRTLAACDHRAARRAVQCQHFGELDVRFLQTDYICFLLTNICEDLYQQLSVEHNKQDELLESATIVTIGANITFFSDEQLCATHASPAQYRPSMRSLNQLFGRLCAGSSTASPNPRTRFLWFEGLAPSFFFFLLYRSSSPKALHMVSLTNPHTALASGQTLKSVKVYGRVEGHFSNLLLI